jgi:hypothetical protein
LPFCTSAASLSLVRSALLDVPEELRVKAFEKVAKDHRHGWQLDKITEPQINKAKFNPSVYSPIAANNVAGIPLAGSVSCLVCEDKVDDRTNAVCKKLLETSYAPPLFSVNGQV